MHIKSEKGASINMNDEMKEPNEEQAPSSSDERKPNIEGKKFSAGADNAPSPEKQPSNEDDVACTKDERDSHLTRVIHKFGGKNEPPSQLLR